MPDDYQYAPCEECQAYGDDYYIDDDGELVWGCDGCPFGSYYDLWLPPAIFPNN